MATGLSLVRLFFECGMISISLCLCISEVLRRTREGEEFQVRKQEIFDVDVGFFDCFSASERIDVFLSEPLRDVWNKAIFHERTDFVHSTHTISWMNKLPKTTIWQRRKTISFQSRQKLFHHSGSIHYKLSTVMNNIKSFSESNRKIHKCHYAVKDSKFSVNDILNVQSLQTPIVELSIR